MNQKTTNALRELIFLTLQEISKHNDENYYNTQEDVNFSNCIYENSVDLKIIDEEWIVERLKYSSVDRYNDLLKTLINKFFKWNIKL